MDDKFKYILEKSRDLFMEYGLRSISMDDIARSLSISKKTLYQYVDNKADLIEKLFNELLCKHKQVSEVISKNPELNAIDQLLEVSKIIMLNIKSFKSSIKFEFEKYYPEIFKNFFEKKRDLIFEDMTRNMRQGIKEGLYREDLKVDLVASLYMKKMEDLHDSEYFHKMKFSFDDIFEVMFSNHIRGIANTKGIKYLEKKTKDLNFNL
jgi:AcrR family transcriptional regulator